MRASQATSTTSTSDRPSFRLVGGKGGVGKTTCAAALATRDALAGRRTLLITTDPAPSLADALGTPLTSVPRRIRLARGRLDAAEIDAAAAMARWMRGRAATLRTIAVRGSWLDEDDVRALMELSLPGLDEIAALLELARPAGTTRLWSMPRRRGTRSGCSRFRTRSKALRTPSRGCRRGTVRSWRRCAASGRETRATR
jgi:hypothetical protein